MEFEFTEEQEELLRALCKYAQVFFQLPARVESPLKLSLPESETDLYRVLPLGRRHGIHERQYDASRILDGILLPRLPEDAVAYLGVTMADMWAGDLNYVFGLASIKERVGVYSLCRYFPEFWGETREAG